MEDIGDAQAIALDDLVHAAQHEGQLPGRDGAVHADIVGDAPGGAESRFAALPDRCRLHRRLALLHRLDAVLPGDGDDAGELGVHLGLRALDLDDQQRLDIHRVAGLGEGLADLDRRLVHEFHRDRDDAGADDGGDRRPRLLAAREAEQHRAGALGRAQDAHRRLGDDAELPLRADDQAEQVEPRRVEMGAADFDDAPVEHDQSDAEHVVGGHAVFQAMRPAGIHADIAADRAGELRGRVGRVEEAIGRDGAGDGEIGDAGLHLGDAVRVVDLEDAVHLGNADHHRVLLRDGASGERGSGAARHDRHALLAAIAQHGGDLLGGRGQHDRERHAAIGGQRVGLVGPALILGGDQGLGRDEPGEAGENLLAAGEDIGIRRRKGDGTHGRSFFVLSNPISRRRKSASRRVRAEPTLRL